MDKQETEQLEPGEVVYVKTVAMRWNASSFLSEQGNMRYHGTQTSGRRSHPSTCDPSTVRRAGPVDAAMKLAAMVNPDMADREEMIRQLELAFANAGFDWGTWHIAGNIAQKIFYRAEAAEEVEESPSTIAIKKDNSFWNRSKVSRGWYICLDEHSGNRYLHADGEVRVGLHPELAQAFWPTEEDARSFYDEWSSRGATPDPPQTQPTAPIGVPVDRFQSPSKSRMGHPVDPQSGVEEIRQCDTCDDEEECKQQVGARICTGWQSRYPDPPKPQAPDDAQLTGRPLTADDLEDMEREAGRVGASVKVFNAPPKPRKPDDARAAFEEHCIDYHVSESYPADQGFFIAGYAKGRDSEAIAAFGEGLDARHRAFLAGRDSRPEVWTDQPKEDGRYSVEFDVDIVTLDAVFDGSGAFVWQYPNGQRYVDREKSLKYRCYGPIPPDDPPKPRAVLTEEGKDIVRKFVLRNWDSVKFHRDKVTSQLENLVVDAAAGNLTQKAKP